jgi:hypothetical protein
MVTLRTYSNPAEAAMAKSVLENHNIICSLADENSNLYGGGPLAMPIRLLVAEVQIEQAAQILDNVRQPLPDDFDPGSASLEGVMNFCTDKAVLFTYNQALRLGWQTKEERRSGVIRVM